MDADLRVTDTGAGTVGRSTVKASIVWAGVALVAIVALAGVGLSFGGWSDQAVGGWTSGIGVFAATVFGLLVKLETKTDKQSDQLDVIEAKADVAAVKSNEIAQRVNGELDQRIAAAMEEAAETGAARAIAELRRQGFFR
jgi:hypothetical protein